MRQHRKPNRWGKFNYSANATYFITICTKDRVCQFGEIVAERMKYNSLGLIVLKHIKKLNDLFDDGIMHIAQVMPNHVHLLYTLNNEQKDKFYLKAKKINEQRFKMILPQRIKSFKRSVSKEINDIDGINFFWQRSFHDHIVRDKEAFNKIYWYIKSNPKNWKEDNDNLINV